MKGFLGRPGPPRTPKCPIAHQITKHPPLPNPHKIALELVSEADFWCKLISGAGPVDLGVSRGPRGRPDPPKLSISGRSTNHILKTQVKIFGSVFLGFSAEVDLRDTPRSQGPAPHINLHEKSVLQTNSKAKWRRAKNPARLPSGTQLPA